MLDFASKTHIGSRICNEDCTSVFTMGELDVFLLCDGLGGYGNGDIASKMACDVFKESFCTAKGTIDERVTIAMNNCEEIILRMRKPEGGKKSISTTLCGLVLDDNEPYCVHCGDSRVYRFVNGKYVWRTEDHSLPQMLVMLGDIEPDKIRHHSDRNKLLAAIGQDKESFNYTFEKLVPNDGDMEAFLLCSDGLWELITGDEMAKELNLAFSAEHWLERIFTIVVNRGGIDMDNSTAIAVIR